MRHHLKRLFAIISILIIHYEAFSQANINSSTGYTVHITVIPIQVIPSTTVCPYGYNYNLRVNYMISFTGNNIPPALYTLQGSISCGSQTHFFSLPLSGGTGSAVTTSNPWRGVSDCNTVTVHTLSCNTATIRIQGPGINTQNVNLTINYTPLAVNLVEFNATAMSNFVKVKWSTATETDNAFFTIERSANGIQWSTLDTIRSNGNSINLRNYQFNDNSPLEGANYYRLKQTDITGQSNFSETRVITYKYRKTNISLYPIPNTGNTITLQGIDRYNDYELVLYDALGSKVFATQLKSSNTVLPAIPKGLYFIQLTNKLTAESEVIRYLQL